MLRSLLVLTLASLAVVLVVLTLVWLGQRRLMYFPYAEVPSPSAVGLAAADEVEVTTADGVVLGAWYVAAARRPPDGRAFTLLVCNGNAGNRAFRADLARAFAEAGVAVLLFDYRGFGDSEGTPHEAGLALDVRAARDWLITRRGVPARDLVYFGESLGAAVAIELALQQPPAALVLRSPFTSMTDMASLHYPMLPAGLLLRDRFPSLDRIGRIRAPLLVIAGDRDAIVPLAHSRRLYDAAREPKTFALVEGADHNDPALTAGPEVVSSTLRWLATLPRDDAAS